MSNPGISVILVAKSGNPTKFPHFLRTFVAVFQNEIHYCFQNLKKSEFLILIKQSIYMKFKECSFFICFIVGRNTAANRLSFGILL